MIVEHIGIAVKNLALSEKIFKDIFGIEPTAGEHIESENVRLSTFRIGESTIELLEGTSDDSAIKKFLSNKKGDTLHHIAFRVGDLEQKLNELQKKGYDLVEGYPKRGKEGSRVAFLHPRSTGVLIELVQK